MARPRKNETAAKNDQMTVIDLDKVKAIVDDMSKKAIVNRVACDSYGQDYARAVGYLARCVQDLMIELHMGR